MVETGCRQVEADLSLCTPSQVCIGGVPCLTNAGRLIRHFWLIEEALRVCYEADRLVVTPATLPIELGLPTSLHLPFLCSGAFDQQRAARCGAQQRQKRGRRPVWWSNIRDRTSGPHPRGGRCWRSLLLVQSAPKENPSNPEFRALHRNG